MSCGNPHETDCSEVMDRLFEYIDGEVDLPTVEKIRVHLDECAPCLREYDLDTAVKTLVARAGRSSAPDGLRERILQKITDLRVSLD